MKMCQLQIEFAQSINQLIQFHKRGTRNAQYYYPHTSCNKKLGLLDVYIMFVHLRTKHGAANFECCRYLPIVSHTIHIWNRFSIGLRLISWTDLPWKNVIFRWPFILKMWPDKGFSSIQSNFYDREVGDLRARWPRVLCRCKVRGTRDYLLYLSCFSVTSGQTYKASTNVNYDSRVIVTSKMLIFTTLDM